VTPAPPPDPGRPAPSGSGWYPIARSDDVSAVPLAARTPGRDWVAFRPAPGAPAAVVAATCPHRLVRLDHATVVDGRVQCPYHGWRFGPDGRCVEIPSNGPDVAVPPRAHLAVPWGVREADGWVWAAPVDPDAADPDAADPDAADPDVGDAGVFGDAGAARLGPVLGNLDPALARAWHPLALATEVPPDGTPLAARLLGRAWTVRSAAHGLAVSAEDGSAPHAVAERFGLVWVAPAGPATPLIDCPDDVDPGFVGAWLPPERSASPAAVLAENFLDVAHFPFVHAGTFGAAEERYVPPFDVRALADRLTSVQEQWFDNPADPGVAAGRRPLRQRRRASYAYQVPFQLTLRLEELDAGAVKTILFVLQPEDAASTRIYTKMILHGIGGVARPGPDVVAAEVAFEQAVLAEDLHLQRAMTVPGLPLRLRDEVHVRSDRSGVALRRILRRVVGLDPAS